MGTLKIEFENKVGIVPKGVRINQVWDEDINEIKSVVNSNAEKQISNTNIIENIINNGDFNTVSYNEDFIYAGGVQEFLISTPGIVVKNVFRGRLKLFKNEYTIVDNLVTITYDTLEINEKISITN